MNISDFRIQYPQYDGIDDATIANAVYEKHYSNKLSLDVFNERFLGKQPEEKEAGIGRITGGLLDFAKGSFAGIGHGESLQGMLGKSMQFFDRPGGIDIVRDYGKRIEESAIKREEEIDFLKQSEAGKKALEESWYSPRGSAYGGGKMVAPSLGPMAAGAVTGAAIGTFIFPGIGTVAGASIGGFVGFLGVTPLYFGSQGESTYREGIKKGIGEEAAREAAIKTGAIEAGGEFIANLVTFGVARHIPKKIKKGIISEMTKAIRSPVSLIKSIGLIVGTEVGTELGQAYTQQDVEYEANIIDEKPSWDSVKDVVMPTIILSMATFGMAETAGGMRRRELGRILSDPDVDHRVRARTVATIGKAIGDQDAEMEALWYEYTAPLLIAGKPIVAKDFGKAQVEQRKPPEQKLDESETVEEAVKAAEEIAGNPIDDAGMDIEEEPQGELDFEAAAAEEIFEHEDEYIREDELIFGESIDVEVDADILAAEYARQQEVIISLQEDEVEEVKTRSAAARERHEREKLINPEKDSVLTAIAKGNKEFNGLNKDEAIENGVDPADINKRGWGFNRVFTKNGGSLDFWAEALSQDGYDVFDEEGNYDANKLLDIVHEELAGRPSYSNVATDILGEKAVAEREEISEERSREEMDGVFGLQRDDWLFADEEYEGLETNEDKHLGDIASYAAKLGLSDELVENIIERGAIQGLTNDEIKQQLAAAATETGQRIRDQGTQLVERQEGQVQEDVAPTTEGEQQISESTVGIFQKAKNKYGEEGVKQAIDDHLAQFEGEDLSLEEEAAQTEIATRKLLDGIYDDFIPAIEEKVESKKEIDEAVNEAATSPTNELPEPTGAQIEADNFKKGHPRPALTHGLTISIENPKGSTRKSKPGAKKKWEIELKDDYGDIKGYKGNDGDDMDVFLGRGDKIFIVDQVDPETGKFDEHKVMMDYANILGAKVAYNRNYEKGWKGLGEITEVTEEELKNWLENGDKSIGYADREKVEKKVITPVTPKEKPVLEEYSLEDIARMQAEVEAAEKEKRDIEAKAKADEELGEFALTGSARTADIAAAAGQEDIFAQPEEAEVEKPVVEAVTGKPLGLINIEVEYEVENEDGTIETITKKENAAKLLSKTDKQIDDMKALVVCMKAA